jgi:nicotinate phosphoribosyltransferase
MQNGVCKLFPREIVRYEFINRGKHQFPENFGKSLQVIVDSFADLRLSIYERLFLLEKVNCLDPVYIAFLNGYRFNPSEVKIEQTGTNLKVQIEGPWHSAILWEVPLLAAISELYYDMLPEKALSIKSRLDNNKYKMEALRELEVKVIEFGTRRRHSYDVQQSFIIGMEKYLDVFLGTSNLHMAQEYGWMPIGTQAHEWIMFHAAKFGYKMANSLSMENWVNVYNGDLGIVLPDTLTTDVFLRSFTTLQAKLFDGGRLDSGDPIQFMQKWVNHYQKLHIDPSSKTIVFSDGINSIDKIKNIHQRAKELGIKDVYGIGTWFTNDVGLKPLNIVIKMSAVKDNDTWIPTVKLSDTLGKHSGPTNEIELCKRTLGL